MNDTIYAEQKLKAIIMADKSKKLEKSIEKWKSNDIDISEQTVEGTPLLHFAVKNRSIECIRLLVDYQAVIDKLDAYRQNALYLACRLSMNCNGHQVTYFEIINILIENGSDCKQPNEYTCLMMMCESAYFSNKYIPERVSIIKSLINRYGSTAEAIAMRNGNCPEILDCLRTYKLDPVVAPKDQPSQVNQVTVPKDETPVPDTPKPTNIAQQITNDHASIKLKLEQEVEIAELELRKLNIEKERAIALGIIAQSELIQVTADIQIEQAKNDLKNDKLRFESYAKK